LSQESEKGAGRGRPGSLTRESIVREALKIPAEEFSLGRLADSLDVSPQSLYHYFPNKQSIASAMMEEVNRTVPMADRNLPWREYLRSILLGYRGFLKVNGYAFARGLPLSGLSIFRVGGKSNRAMLERFDGFMEVFRRAGLGPEECIEVWIIFQNFIRRSDLHRASQQSLLAGWEELQNDLSEIDEAVVPELQGLRGKPCPDIEEIYQGVVDNIIEGISVRYEIK